MSSADRSTTEDLGEADALDALPGAETPESPSAAPAFPRAAEPIGGLAGRDRGEGPA